jgi:hypothetical protein
MWKNAGKQNIDLTFEGYKVEDGAMKPIHTSVKPMAKLEQMNACGGKDCVNNRCSCVRLGLVCTGLCSCTNCKNV